MFDFLHCVKVKSRVPEEGSFYAYTIMTDKNNKKASLAKVFIPEDALRATTTRGNCQVNYCIIEELESPLGDKISKGSIKAERINNINDLKIDNEDAITIYPTKGECRDALVKYYEHL